MRQTHAGGEKVFVDYCGQTMTVHDPVTGDAQEAQIFCGLPGGEQLHLCRSHTRSNLAPLDWLP